MKQVIKCLATIIFAIFLNILIILPAQAADINADNLDLQCSCTCQPVQANEEETEPATTEEPEVIVFKEGDVVISEFVSDPITGEKEWVELYNTTDNQIDLTGWILAEGSGQQTNLSGIISSHGYLVVEKSSLNNSGDIIVLSDNNDLIIDQVAYGDFDDGDIEDNAPAASDPYSVMRLNVDNDTDIDVDDFVVTTNVTKGSANIYEPLPVAQLSTADNSGNSQNQTGGNIEETSEQTEEQENFDFSNEIRINELFPDPAGADTGLEWIELYNYSQQAINLKGWQIDDIEGGSTPYLINDDLIIAAADYIKLDNDLTKITLNNSTDSARLIDPDGQIIDQVDYDNVIEDDSYAFFDNLWLWTQTPTPGAQNVLEVASKEDDLAGGLIKAAAATTANKSKEQEIKKSDNIIETSLDKVREMEIGTQFKVKGIVSVEPNVFGKQIVYLNGLQVYFSKAEWPEFKVGDEVELIGKLSESNNEKRILISAKEDIQVLSSGHEVEPLTIKAEEIGEEKEGYLVQLTGELGDKSGSKLTLIDETGEAIIYLKQGTEISSKLFNVGEKLQIIGILSQYKDEYRVMPRSINDIVNLSLINQPISGEPAVAEQILPNNKKSKVVIFIMATLGFLLVAAGALSFKYREKIIEFWLKIKLRRKGAS